LPLRRYANAACGAVVAAHTYATLGSGVRCRSFADPADPIVAGWTAQRVREWSRNYERDLGIK
jgi:hypothetical protein